MTTLNPIFCNNMIMQANKPLRIFGKGEGLARVEFMGKRKAISPKGADWMIELDAVDYGGPYEIKVLLTNECVILKNVYFGDVYLLGGQSNMQFKLHESSEPKENYRGNKKTRFDTVFFKTRLTNREKFGII